MTQLVWDQAGARLYETGVDRGVLFVPNAQGDYATGVAWNGLTSVSESPSGAEANKQYADNIAYLNLISAEEFGATIEAYTYPDEFAQFDGSASPTPGVTIGQQTRKAFGFCYRTRIGNDLQGTDLGYKIHIVYGATAAPTEKAYNTVNDSPEAITFSWEVSTVAVAVPGYKPSATLVIDSTKVNAAKLADVENILYGTAGSDPRLPQPQEIIAIFSGAPLTTVTPTAPTYNSTTKVITFPTITGVAYYVNGVVRTGTFTITENTVVKARPTAGYKFPAVVDDDWFYSFT